MADSLKDFQFSSIEMDDDERALGSMMLFAVSNEYMLKERLLQHLMALGLTDDDFIKEYGKDHGNRFFESMITISDGFDGFMRRLADATRARTRISGIRYPEKEIGEPSDFIPMLRIRSDLCAIEHITAIGWLLGKTFDETFGEDMGSVNDIDGRILYAEYSMLADHLQAIDPAARENPSERGKLMEEYFISTVRPAVAEKLSSGKLDDLIEYSSDPEDLLKAALLYLEDRK